MKADLYLISSEIGSQWSCCRRGVQCWWRSTLRIKCNNKAAILKRGISLSTNITLIVFTEYMYTGGMGSSNMSPSLLSATKSSPSRKKKKNHLLVPSNYSLPALGELPQPCTIAFLPFFYLNSHETEQTVAQTKRQHCWKGSSSENLALCATVDLELDLEQSIITVRIIRSQSSELHLFAELKDRNRIIKKNTHSNFFVNFWSGLTNRHFKVAKTRPWMLPFRVWQFASLMSWIRLTCVAESLITMSWASLFLLFIVNQSGSRESQIWGIKFCCTNIGRTILRGLQEEIISACLFVCLFKKMFSNQSVPSLIVPLKKKRVWFHAAGWRFPRLSSNINCVNIILSTN